MTPESFRHDAGSGVRRLLALALGCTMLGAHGHAGAATPSERHCPGSSTAAPVSVLFDTDFNSAVFYESRGESWSGRPSWDQTAVLAGVCGPAPIWGVVDQSALEFLPTPPVGEWQWLDAPDSDQAHLIAEEPLEQVAQRIDDLMITPPRNVCDEGDIPQPLTALLEKRLDTVRRLLQKAEAAAAPSRQLRLRRQAVSRLAKVEKKTRKLARASRLAEACTDDVLATIAGVQLEARSHLIEVPIDWSSLEGFKYRYAGAAIQEKGERHLYYCANIDRDDRFPITDHIVMRTARRTRSGRWVYGEEQVAIWPGEKSESGEPEWDFEHTCDPTIVAGTFWYRRPGESEQEKFRYALFYLGIPGLPDYLDGIPDGNVNQIGWAVANDPEGPWHKVGTGPLITSDAAGFWGVGQPSAVSLDKKGDVVLFYTRGEEIRQGTFRQRVSLLDANDPVLHGELGLTTDGLVQSDGTPNPANFGGAFVYDDETDRFYVIRGGHPFPAETCPDFISAYLQVAYLPAENVWAGDGTWTIVANLRHQVMPRLFDAGWVRNRFGRLTRRHTLEAVVAVSEAHGTPPCLIEGLGTYRIHGALIPK